MRGKDLLLGALVGAAAGVLLAPDSGAKTRKKLKEESDRLAKNTKKKANDFASSLTSTIDEIRNKVSEKSADLREAKNTIVNAAHSTKNDVKQELRSA